MLDVFLHRCFIVIIAHFDVDKGDNFGLQAVLRRLDNNNEFLAHLRPDLQCDLLLQLLGDRVLNEPAVELDLRVLDEGAVLVLERQLVAVVLAENGVTIELLRSRNGHAYDLLLVTYVGEE